MPLVDLFHETMWTIHNVADFLDKADVQNLINVANFSASVFLPILRTLREWSRTAAVRLNQDAAKGQV